MENENGGQYVTWKSIWVVFGPILLSIVSGCVIVSWVLMNSLEHRVEDRIIEHKQEIRELRMELREFERSLRKLQSWYTFEGIPETYDVWELKRNDPIQGRRSDF